MDDFMLIEYLKRKGLYNISDQEFDEKFKDVMYQHFMKNFDSSLHHPDTHESQDKVYYYNKENMPYFEKSLTHFNDPYAKYIVSNMCHYHNGRKYIGEKFDMIKAKEVCERFRGIIPQTVSIADVYVAINSQYHNYCELFNSWFGEDIDHKIIESAIIFWFKDDNYKEGSKIWNYFKEK